MKNHLHQNSFVHEEIFNAKFICTFYQSNKKYFIIFITRHFLKKWSKYEYKLLQNNYIIQQITLTVFEITYLLIYKMIL